MLTPVAAPAKQQEPASRPGPRRHAGGRTLRRRRALTFAVAFALPTVLALSGGGYDVVVRHEWAMAVWALIAVGLLLGLLPRAQLALPQQVALGGLAALAGLTALSMLWADSDEAAYYEVARVLGYLGLATLIALTVNRFTWRAAANGLAAALALVTLAALASRLFPDSLPQSDVSSAFDAARLAYPLDYWNAVAGWAAMTLAAMLSFASQARSAALRAAAAAIAPAAVLTIYLTYSRGGVVVSAVAAIAVVALARNRWTAGAQVVATAGAGAILILIARANPEIADATGASGGAELALATLAAGAACAGLAIALRGAGADRLRMPVPTAISAAVIFAIVVVTGLLLAAGQIGDVWEEFKHGDAVAVKEGEDVASRLTTAGGNRYEYWSEAGDAFGSAPLAGIGAGGFESYWARHAPVEESVRDAHTLYVEQLAELGLLGAAALAVALGGLAWGALRSLGGRRSRRGGEGLCMLVVLVVWLADAGIDWIWEVPAMGAVGLGAGFIAIAARTDRASRRSRLRHPVIAGCLALLAAVAVVVQVPGLSSTQRSRAAEAARIDGDSTRAVSLATDAIDAMPWSATAYYVRAKARIDEGELRLAAEDARTAAAREPDVFWHRLLLSEIAIRRERGEQAKRELDAALRLGGRLPVLAPESPLRASYEFRVAEVLAAQGSQR